MQSVRRRRRYLVLYSVPKAFLTTRYIFFIMSPMSVNLSRSMTGLRDVGCVAGTH